MTEVRDALEVPAGTVIFREGDPGEEMFLIARGRVRLALGHPRHDEELAVLKAGSFFGELSLLTGSPRTATATALGARLMQTDRQVHRLAGTLTRLRGVADLLRRCLAAGASSISIEVEELARAWDTSAETVETLLADVARKGIGTLDWGCWTANGAEAARRLADVLCRWVD